MAARLIQLNETSGIRLVRRTLSDGAERDVALPANVRLTPWTLAPNAISRSGRLALRITQPGNWFWPAAIVDLRRRSVELLPNASTTDMFVPGWDDQERVVTIGNTMARGTLWRFQAARPH